MTVNAHGPLSSVLQALLKANPNVPYNPADPTQRRYASISSGPNMPFLPSLTDEAVFMPENAFLDGNALWSGYLATQGLTGATAASRLVGATVSGAPTTGTFATGDFVIDQSGAVWICIAAGSPGSWTSPGGLANPMTASGDLIAGGSGGAPVRLAKGANNTVLGVVAGALTWVTQTSGFANPMNAAGQIIAGGSGGTATALPLGTAGQSLAAVYGGANPVLGYANTPVEWVNAVTFGGADPTGATDSTAAITRTITAAGNASPNGGVAYLPAGVYLTKTPLIVTDQVLLLGAIPSMAGTASGNTPDYAGTVIKADPSWARGTIAAGNNPGIVYVNGDTNANPAPPINKPGVMNLWIDGSGAPAGTHGLSVWGSAFHGIVSGVGVYQAPAAGMIFAPDSNGLRSDGWTFRDCMVQTFGTYGIWWHGQDTQFINCHVQNSQASTTDLGCWYIDNGNNCLWVACRGDQGVYGFVFDSNPGGATAVNTPGATQRMVACGTENTYSYGLFLKNSSGGSAQMRTPVAVETCSFDFSGRDGASAAVNVLGYNILTGNFNVTCAGPNGQFYPATGMTTTAGTGGSHQGIPALIDVSGFWNVTGPTMVADNANAGTTTGCILRYRIYGAVNTNIIGGNSPTPITHFISTPYP